MMLNIFVAIDRKNSSFGIRHSNTKISNIFACPKNHLVFMILISFVISPISFAAKKTKGVIGLVEIQTVEFGVVPKMTGTCVMTVNGQLGGMCLGLDSGLVGVIQVSAEPGYPIQITLTDSVTVNGVNFSPRFAENSTQSIVVTVDSTRSRNFNIVGMLDVQNPSNQSVSLSYDFLAEYEHCIGTNGTCWLQ